MIETYQIHELNDLPIESVASRLGLEVERHKCLCPFHEDRHPSLTFSNRHNRYRCFVCGAHGRPIDLVMNMEHLTFPQACRWLASDTGVILHHSVTHTPTKADAPKPFQAERYLGMLQHPWLSDTARDFLFTERMLDRRVIRWCRLNSWQDRQGSQWLQIPYFDTRGYLVGIQNRNLDCRIPGKESLQPRFRFPPGSRCSIYNMQILPMLSPGESLFITEGCSDCWAMLSSGHKAIAIPSATLLCRDDLAMLQHISEHLGTRLEMYPDQDEPGERLFLQLRQHLPHIIRHQLPSGCKDYSEYYLAMKRNSTSSIENVNHEGYE